MSGLNNTNRRPLIVGHFGGCNTGDEAMLAGLLGALAQDMKLDASVVVKSEKSVNGLLSQWGANPVPAGFLPVVRALLRTDALVLGGGTHFHDDYTTARFLRHFRYMLRFVTLSMLAKLLGRKVTWLGMGFGPFYRRPTRWITRLGLGFCDRVSVRDLRSLEEIAAWIPPSKLALAFDLAALLATHSRGRIARHSPEPFRCSRVGVSITSVKYSRSGGGKTDEIVGRHLANALNQSLCDDPNLQARVIVLRGGNREDDGAISHELHRAVSAVHPGRVELIPYHPEPTVILQRIAECDAFVATRYHAGVLAYLAGCRLLLLEYHRKVRDLAREIKLPDQACLSLSEDLDEEVFVNRLRCLTHGDAAFRPCLPVCAATQRAMLNIRALEEMF